MKVIIEYSSFKCNLISSCPKYDDIIMEFYKNFNNYYYFDFGMEDKNIFTIYLCDYVDKDIFNHIGYDTVLIHNSHSKNKKILLNGTIYMQQDALKYVDKISKSNADYFRVLKTNTYIKLTEKNLVMCGNNIYGDLVYVFETLLNTFFEETGRVSLHAASCLVNDEGVIICGCSGSGKTTLLFDLIKNSNAIFQANDRVSIYKGIDNSLYVCGIPIPVNVPRKTMIDLEKWKDTEIVKKSVPGDKIRFSVEEIPLIFDRTVNRDIKLKKILITDYNKSKNPSAEKLSVESALEKLDILSPFDFCHPNWLKVYASNRTDAAVKNIMKNWLESIDVYLLSGNNPYESFCRL